MKLQEDSPLPFKLTRKGEPLTVFDLDREFRKQEDNVQFKLDGYQTTSNCLLSAQDD